MNNPDNIFTLQFPEAKSIIVSGDIHGDFNILVNKQALRAVRDEGHRAHCGWRLRIWI